MHELVKEICEAFQEEVEKSISAIFVEMAPIFIAKLSEILEKHGVRADNIRVETDPKNDIIFRAVVSCQEGCGPSKNIEVVWGISDACWKEH